MTDLGQQQGGQPQFYAQPQMMQQPYGSQPMVYSPQQVAYPPQPQAPMGYSHEGVPQVSYVSVSPYVQNEPQVFIQQGGVPQEHVGYDMGEVPMKNYNHVEEHSYEHEEQKPDHFVGFIDHDPIQTLPSVVTCSDVINWFKEAWHMYAENWVPYTLVALIFMIFWGGSFVADDEAPAWVSTFLSGGTLLTMPLYWGFFIAGTQVYKQKERLLRESNGACVHVVPQFVDFFRGYFLFFPLWGLGIVLPLIVGLGFLLFIIPGIYLLVTLYFTCYVYIEYHPQHQYEATQHQAVSYGFCESIAHTRRVAHQHFWEIGFFILLQWAIAIIGSCTIVGGLIAFPVASLAMIPAFRDLYGFQMNRVPDERCYCCC